MKFARWRRAIAGILLCVAPSAAERLPQFEVATIKPTNPNAKDGMGAHIYPGGRVVLQGFPLKALIGMAFDAAYWQISGGEPWTGNAPYDVQAKPPEGSAIRTLGHTWLTMDDPTLREMLQALLIDRFHLTFHRETKTGKVYLLETSGKTLKLQPTKAKQQSGGMIGFVGNTGEWVLHDTTMPQLARFASDSLLHCTVLDRTGLAGAFDYRSPAEDLALYRSDKGGSFRHLLGEMGLKLETTQGPVERFVIDGAERPSAN